MVINNLFNAIDLSHRFQREKASLQTTVTDAAISVVAHFKMSRSHL